MSRNSKEDLLAELKQNHGLLEIKALSEYKKNGVILRLDKADTGFSFDRKLILSDGSSIVAWI